MTTRLYAGPTTTLEEAQAHLESVTIPRITELKRIREAHIARYPKRQQREARNDYEIMHRKWADEWMALQDEQRRLRHFTSR